LNESTGDVLVYNGEIYNAPELRVLLESEGFHFRGHSDTEILLRGYERWSTDCLDKLRGMFALALWDARRLRLVIARDHLGIKPLYYAADSGSFVCASEVRALLKSGLVAAEIDERAMAGYLAYGAVQEPLTMYRRVYSLPPGCWRELDRSGTVVAQGTYWRFPEIAHSARQRPRKEIVAEGRALLARAVRRHMLSDVPVGMFLSSGLDSTAMLGFCGEQDSTSQVESFTVSFPDWPEYNEATMARAVADRFGVRHHEITVSDSTALKWLKDGLNCMDQPSMDGLNTYIVARAVGSQAMAVALSGLGGDEVFGGYPVFRRVPSTYATMSWLGTLPSTWRVAAARAGTVFKNPIYQQRAREIAERNSGLIGTYFQFRRLISDEGLRMLGFSADALGLSQDFQLNDLQYERHYVPSDFTSSVGRMETSFYMRNMLLRDSDVFGMANSLEIRVPFLDRDLVEWAFRLPGDVLLPRGGKPKSLLRSICADLYAGAQKRQPKRGFVIPIERWLRGPLQDVAEESLRWLRGSGFLQPEGVQAVYELYTKQMEHSAWSRVWALVAVGHWLRQNQVLSACSAAS